MQLCNERGMQLKRTIVQIYQFICLILCSSKLNFGHYMTFQLTFYTFLPDNFAFYLLHIANFERFITLMVL